MQIILQARVGSTRLPRKVLLPFRGKLNVLRFCWERVELSGYAAVIAAPNTQQDRRAFSRNDFVEFACDEKDVLGRYLAVANRCTNVDVDHLFVRITSDCPLVDVSCIEQMENIFYSNKLDYLSNCHPVRHAPSGFDVEMFSMPALEEANYRARTDEEREHVTPYMWKNMRAMSVALPKASNIDINQKFSIDTMADYKRVRFLAAKLYEDFNINFTMQGVLNCAEKYALHLEAIEDENKA